MKKIFVVTVVSLVMICTMTAFAAQEFKFTDGTLIRGNIQDERVRIKTQFGNLTPKVSEIVFVSAGKIELSDGSQVMGELLPEVPPTTREQGTETPSPGQKKGLLFKTKYGTFELLFSMEDIEHIDFKK
jgi:hypothetical protein